MSVGPLVVSLVATSFESLGHALEGGAAAEADVVELRLDHLADEVRRDPEGLRALIRRAARPVIAAVHGDEGFGAFRGDAAARRELLAAAAAAGAEFVDVDERFAEAIGDLGVPRILSSHREAGTRDELDRLAGRLDSLAQPGRDLVKLAPAASDARQGIELLRWLAGRPTGSTVALATGDAGAFTRLLAPAFGGALTFAGPPARGQFELKPAAPGQLAVDHVRAVWPGRAPTTATEVALVCGDPIGHSAGPVVHGAALEVTGVDGVLAATTVPPAVALELAPRLAGLSITAPYKVEGLKLAGDLSPAARAIGALNTLEVGAAGAELGSNTDAPAIGEALQGAGVELKGAAALVIGAGGAARAAVYALKEAGASVTVAARRGAAAAELGGDRAVSLAALRDLGGQAPKIIVHATPLGTEGRGDAPVPPALLTPGVTVLDAVYRPRRTELLRLAASRGAGTVEGSEWFLQQAWLQHLRIFRRGYAERYGGPGPPVAVVRVAMSAMAAALGAWLGEEVG